MVSDPAGSTIRPRSHQSTTIPPMDWVTAARELAATFALRAPEHDRAGSFPFENFADLRAAGFFGLTVPERFGGAEVPLATYLAVLEALARGDGSTALAFMMHLKTFGQERDAPSYPPEWLDQMARGALEHGYLVNTVATEEGLGSPAGGGLPETVAIPSGDGWLLDGRKTFATLAPVLHYFIVLARVPVPEGETPRVSNFMVLRTDPGVRIEATWDSLGMRATGSHDVVFDGVRLSPERLLNGRALGAGDARGGAGMAWFALGICAVTLGVATAARDYAVTYARERTPNSNRTIKDYPGVRTRIARMDLLIQRSRALMDDACRAWEAGSSEGMPVLNRVAVAKIEALNSCIEAVDLAMRVVGGVSLQKSRPIERYYRDVRAPLHNPPLEDRALEMLARSALDEPIDPAGPAE